MSRFQFSVRSWSAISRLLPQFTTAQRPGPDGGGIYSPGTLSDTGNLFFDNTGGDIYS